VHLTNFGFGGQVIASKALRFLAGPLANIKIEKVIQETKPNLLRRILAGIIDYGIVFGITYFLILIIGEPNENGVMEINGAPVFIPIFFWLFFTVGLESEFGGTIGNKIAGLKVISISRNGPELTFQESFKRHFLDLIDMSFFGIPGIITIKNTTLNQRLGDLWAKTIVVKND
jgi:uncharacterized RDD family membrane protein YckC